MRVKEIFEAKYEGGDWQWREIVDISNQYGYEIGKYIKENSKILQKIFEEMKKDFFWFYETTIDHMDEMPEEYDEKDRSPKDIYSYWWDQFPGDLSEPGNVWAEASKKLGGPMFGDAMQVMSDFIHQNTQRVVDEM